MEVDGDGDAAQRPFGDKAVDLDGAVVAVTQRRGPPIQRALNRSGRERSCQTAFRSSSGVPRISTLMTQNSATRRSASVLSGAGRAGCRLWNMQRTCAQQVSLYAATSVKGIEAGICTAF